MENSKIEWTDNTFNPWLGCSQVHTGCKNCYAEELMANRYKTVEWGDKGTRKRTSKKNWTLPLNWNKQAIAEGRKIKVFCASLADIFEDKPEDGLDDWRADLFKLIDATPNLIWQILTKRPENIRSMWPVECDQCGTERANWQYSTDNRCPNHAHPDKSCDGVLKPVRRENVWLGTSPCDQQTAQKSIPPLLMVSDLCSKLFLSAEPLVGPMSLLPFLHTKKIHWVIYGGESGAHARPCNVNWIKQGIVECKVLEVIRLKA
jgi:protein gp37